MNLADRLAGSSAIVTGASRGFGRAIAAALSASGAHVVGVARTSSDLDELRDTLGSTFTAVPADAADPVAAGRLLDEHRPRTLVLCAGATPQMSRLANQALDVFRKIWAMGLAPGFRGSRHALQLPLPPGSTVIAISRGAAVK